MRVAYDLLRSVNATYANIEWDDVAAESLSREGGALGLPESLQGCVGVQSGLTPEEAQVTKEGPADAVVAPELPASSEAGKVGDASATEDRLQEEDDDDGLERGVTVVGVAEDDAVDDTSRQVLRTKQMLLQQMDRQAACDKHEAEMRKHHPTFQHTAERQEIQESERKIRGRINRIHLDIKK